MGNKIVWSLFIFLSVGLLIYFLIIPPTDNGGDMVEYFGMTESVVNHGGVNLTSFDTEQLKKYLSPGYFAFEKQYEETKGGFMAYIPGKDGNTYSLHFWFYSLLVVPIRLILRLLQINELHSLRVTNLLIFASALSYILSRYVKSWKKRVFFIITVFFSPLMFFLIYPGVDVYYSMLFMIAVFAFFNREYFSASLFTALASWHSQPLVIPLLGLLIFEVYSLLRNKEQKKWKNNILHTIFCLIVAFIPYVSNLYMFGVLSPWSTIKDGWTQIYGFGVQNISLQRLFEQFFDLNMGLFWYAPLLLILGVFYLFKASKVDKIHYFIMLVMVATAFGYQTNPAWHYGTAGFGPTRHILFIISFLIYYVVRYFKLNIKVVVVLLIPFVMQIYALFFNHYINPVFFDSMFHSPYAQLILDKYPQLYNPTPKIFVDRTTHSDKKFITSAVYMYNGNCRKAFVTKTDVDNIRRVCGHIPDAYYQLLDNEFTRKASYSRKLYAVSATLSPDVDSCNPDYTPTTQTPYECIRTLQDFTVLAGVSDPKILSRVRSKDAVHGVWTIEKGDVFELTVPPGYTLDYQSLDGTYINY